MVNVVDELNRRDEVELVSMGAQLTSGVYLELGAAGRIVRLYIHRCYYCSLEVE